jgi:hypothetical protein
MFKIWQVFLKRHMLHFTCWKKKREKFVNRSTRSFSAFPQSAPRLFLILRSLLLVPGPHQCILNVFYCHLGFFLYLCMPLYFLPDYQSNPQYLGRFPKRLKRTLIFPILILEWAWAREEILSAIHIQLFQVEKLAFVHGPFVLIRVLTAEVRIWYAGGTLCARLTQRKQLQGTTNAQRSTFEFTLQVNSKTFSMDHSNKLRCAAAK